MFVCPNCGKEARTLIIGFNGIERALVCRGCNVSQKTNSVGLHETYTLPSGKKITKVERQHILSRGLSKDGKTVIHKGTNKLWRW